MKIRNLVKFVLLIAMFNFNKVFCPIFGETGWRKQISLYRSNSQRAIQYLNNSEKIKALKSISNAVQLLNSIKLAETELKLSIPVRIFFYNKRFYLESVITDEKTTIEAFKNYIENQNILLNKMKIAAEKISDEKTKTAKIPLKEFENQVESEAFEYTNDHRIVNGKRPLIWDDTLAKAAKKRAKEMANEEIPSTHFGFERTILDLGYKSPIGENLFLTSPDVNISKIIIDGLMDSPGHRKNLLNNDFKYVGMGIYYKLKPGAYQNHWYFVQLFAASK